MVPETSVIFFHILVRKESSYLPSTQHNSNPPDPLNFSAPAYYVSNETHILLVDGDTRTTVVHQQGGNIVGLAVDEDQNLIFWSNNALSQRGIYRANSDGLEVERIAERGWAHSEERVCDVKVAHP